MTEADSQPVWMQDPVAATWTDGSFGRRTFTQLRVDTRPVECDLQGSTLN
ncbi:hypothetical protein [Terriglobus roseus]|nr:hypothetical protein [Terriglobus roseus]